MRQTKQSHFETDSHKVQSGRHNRRKSKRPQKMIESDFAIGGEQSGHVILREHANTGDGILTALAFLQEMARSKRTAAQLAGQMERFPQVLINVSGVAKERLETSEKISAAVRSAELELGDLGRVLLRASGTEPLVRVMVEASSDSVASSMAASLAEVVLQELG